MYNEKTKQYIYKWRQQHPEEYRTINSKYANEWYERNKVEVCRKKKAQRCLKIEFSRLCGMFEAH